MLALYKLDCITVEYSQPWLGFLEQDLSRMRIEIAGRQDEHATDAVGKYCGVPS